MRAAVGCQLTFLAGIVVVQVLIAAWNAEQLPKPVKKEKKQSAKTLIDPTPPSYATLMG